MNQLLKRMGMLGLVCLLGACANESIDEEIVEEGASSTDVVQSVGRAMDSSEIDEEIAYIETLVGVEEMQAAKAAFDALLADMTGPVTSDTQTERINALKDILSEVELDEYDAHNHTFTGIDAVSLAIERYGTDDDIVYMYDDNHEHYGEDEIGYYVALKSKVLQESEGGDGIVLMLFVGSDGSITEL